MKSRIIPATFAVFVFVSAAQARQQSQQAAPATPSTDSVTIPGQLTAKQAEAFEKLLKETPDDVNTREQLVFYYSYTIAANDKGRDAEVIRHLQDQVFWLIEHHPESKWAASGGTDICEFGTAESCAQGKQLWLEQVQRSPENIAVIQNAARYILSTDQKLAGDLLERALSLNPDEPNTNSLLAQILELQRITDRSPESRNQLAQRALALRETAYQKIDPLQKSTELQRVAIDAFNSGDFAKAEQSASDLLSFLAQNKDDVEYADGIYDAHTVLGLVALNRGDVARAKQELMASALSEGSPVLGSFGPSLFLAQQLLAKGERDAVIAYLEACSKFWEMGRISLKEWIAQIKSGATPNFGQDPLF